MLALSHTRRSPSVGGPAGASDVIGRDCTSQSLPSSIAHSTSCGEPSRPPACRVASPMARSCASLSSASSFDSAGRAMTWPCTSIRHVCPSAAPSTSGSAHPATALMTHTSASPVTGSAPNATPLTLGRSMVWTITAGTGAAPVNPRPRRYSLTRAARADCCTFSIAAQTSSTATPRWLSSNPANELSAPSSSGDEDRTASVPPPRARRARYGSSCSGMSGDRSATTTNGGTARPAARRRAWFAAFAPTLAGSSASVASSTHV